MKPAFIVHGGAWDWSDDLDEPKAKSMRQAALIGWQILKDGGSSLDAVEKAVNFLEDDPLFDAGKGSHLNADGIVEMDAIIVDGTAHDFGAVAAVTRVRYPISLARLVMDKTDHRFFVGSGADTLALKLGMPLIPNMWLVSDEELAAFRRQELINAGGTVGAVALDVNGDIGAATSTGGTPGKPAGRVGDSPIFGSGAYANSAIGGASTTGRGEHTMRVLLAKYAVDQIGTGVDAQTAANLSMTYIDGFFEQSMVGLIVMDHHGKLGAAHTTPKIAIGWIDEDGKPQASMKGLKHKI